MYLSFVTLLMPEMFRCLMTFLFFFLFFLTGGILRKFTDKIRYITQSIKQDLRKRKPMNKYTQIYWVSNTLESRIMTPTASIHVYVNCMTLKLKIQNWNCSTLFRRTTKQWRAVYKQFTLV